MHQTTTTSPGPNFGPLTTVFTPAPACGLAFQAAYASTAASYSLGCPDHTALAGTPTPDPACVPQASAVASTAADWYDLGALYSPGLFCPAGHTTVCAGTAGSSGGGGGDCHFQAPLRAAETGAICCSAGFACSSVGIVRGGATVWAVPFCTREVSSGSLAVGSCTGAGAPRVAEVSWMRPDNPLTLRAPAIQLVWQPSDLPPSMRASMTTAARPTAEPISMPLTASHPTLSTSAPTATPGQHTTAVTESSTTSSTTTPGNKTAATQSPTASSASTLSTGAAVGITVGGTAALIAVIAAVTWLLMRRHRRRQRQDRQEVASGAEAPTDEEKKKAEAELPGDRRFHAQELRTTEKPQELPSPTAPHGARASAPLGAHRGPLFELEA